MTLKSNFKYLCLVLLLGTVGGCVTDANQKTAMREPPPEAFKNADDFLTVDCLLPGQNIAIGMYENWVTPPRPAVLSALECKINGGQYAIASNKNGREKALDVWQESANQGDKIAQNYIGEIYTRNWGEIKPDYVQAAEWYRKSAEQGYSRAQNNLGFLYEHGLGVPKNKQVALGLYRKAMGAVEPIQLDQTIKNEIHGLESKFDQALQTTKDLQKKLSEREAFVQKQQIEIDNLKRLEGGRSNKQAQLELETVRKELTKTQSQEKTLRQQLSDAQQKANALSSQLINTETNVVLKNITNMGKYYALIIGINNYQFPLVNLTTPVNDAKRIEEILQRKYGFDTTLLVDNGNIKPTKRDIYEALYKLSKKIKNEDSLLIYFAGHGDLSSGSAYWLPLDAEHRNDSLWISTDDVTRKISYRHEGDGGIKAKHVLVVADSCYSAAMLTSWVDPSLSEQVNASLPQGLVTRSNHATYFKPIEVAPILSLQSDKSSVEDRVGWIKAKHESISRKELTSGGLEPVIDKEIKNGLSIFANAFTEILEANDGAIGAYEIYAKIGPQIVEQAKRMGARQIPVYAAIPKTGDNHGEFFFVSR